MYRGIRMSSKKLARTTKISIVAEGPILPGSVSTAKSQCGKPNCACKASPPKLHGTYYRWTGFLKGKRTTKTISKEAAEECERRIKKLSRPPGPTRPARGRGFGERTLEEVVRRLQLQKSRALRVQNVGNQKTHNPPVLCAFLAFKTETS